VGAEGIFDIVEVTKTSGARVRLTLVNDSGQAVTTLGGLNPAAWLITPNTDPVTGGPVCFADDDGDTVNDLAVELQSITDPYGIRVTDLSDTGHLSGSGDNSRQYCAAYWADDGSTPDNVLGQVNDYIQDVVFPEYSISYAMMPSPVTAVAVNAGGSVLTNGGGASMVVTGGVAQFLGGTPVCDGCIVGRLNVGTIVYGATGFGTDLNDGGTSCGRVYDETASSYRPAKWSAGGMPTFLGDFGQPWGPGQEVAAINNSGVVVGTLAVASGELHPVVWMGTTPTDLGTLGGTSGAAVDVDDEGAVIGWATNAAGEKRPFLYLPGTRWGIPAGMHDLGDFVDGELETDELPARRNDVGGIVTTTGRLLVIR